MQVDKLYSRESQNSKFNPKMRRVLRPGQALCSSAKKNETRALKLSSEDQSRAISVLRSAQQFRLKDLGGSLMIDDAEHATTVRKAAQDGTLSFGFSAGGCLFPYFIGVSGSLIDKGVLKDETPIAGSSAGALVAATIKSGMPLDQITEQCMKLMHDLRSNGTQGRLGPVLESFLQDHLPENAAQACTDKTHVAVTRAWPYVKPLLISKFSDRDDLIRALMTSCHIPYWLDGKYYTDFRGKPSLDGGLTNFIPLAPSTVGIRISCFPSKQLNSIYRIGISPDNFEPWPYSLRQMVSWAFEPADEKVASFLIDKGSSDALAWVEMMGLASDIDKGQTARAEDVVENVDKSRARVEGQQELEGKVPR